MITGLLIVLVLFEAFRLWVYIKDSRRVREVNKRVEAQQENILKFAEKQNSDWKKIRELEVRELKQLAKESDTMKQIYDEWVKANKP